MKLALAGDTMLGRKVAELHLEKSIVSVEDKGGAEEEDPEGTVAEDGDLEGEAPELVELEDEEPEEVEVGLDEFLRERLEAKEGIDYQAEAAARPVLVATEEDEPRPRAAGEFLCQRCFLIRSRGQLADASRSICNDCGDGR